MTDEKIFEPITIEASYYYKPEALSQYISKNTTKPKENLAKNFFTQDQLELEIKRLIGSEGKSIREACEIVGYSQRTVRGICRTFKLGPYVEINCGELRSTSSQTPYGWRLERGVLRSNSSEMKWVQVMKQMHNGGASFHSIAKALNKKQVPTKNQGQWHAKTVLKILKFNEKFLKEEEGK